MDTAVAQQTLTNGQQLLFQLQSAQQQLGDQVTVANRALDMLAAANSTTGHHSLAEMQLVLERLKSQLPTAIRYNTESIAKLHVQLSQFTEEEQISGGQVAQLQQDCQEMREQLQRQESQIVQILMQFGDRLTQVEQTQPAITTEIANLQAVYERLTQQTAQQIEPLQGEVNRLQEMMVQLKGQLPVAVKANSTALVEMQKEMVRMREQMDQILGDGIPSDVSNEIQAVRAELESLSSQFEATDIRSEVASLQETVASLEAQVAQAADERASIDFKGIQEKLAHLAAMPRSVERNAKSVARLLDRMTKLERRVAKRRVSTQASQMLASLRADVNALKQCLPTKPNLPPARPMSELAETVAQLRAQEPELPITPEMSKAPSSNTASTTNQGQSPNSSPPSSAKQSLSEPFASSVSTFLNFFCPK